MLPKYIGENEPLTNNNVVNMMGIDQDNPKITSFCIIVRENFADDDIIKLIGSKGDIVMTH